MTYTHVYGRNAFHGLGFIVPLAGKGTAFSEAKDGLAVVLSENSKGFVESMAIAEKFADVLERMTAAGLCLQLGSTAPIQEKCPVICIRPDQTVEAVEALRRTIKGQEEQIIEARQYSQMVQDSIRLVFACPDPEISGLATTGGLVAAVAGLVAELERRHKARDEAQAEARELKRALQMSEAGALEVQKNLHALENKVAMRDMVGGAAVGLLQGMLGGLDAANSLIGQTMTEADLDNVRDWIGATKASIEEYLAAIA